MKPGAFLSLFLIQCLAGLSIAFQRNVPDASPFTYPYTKLAGTVNISSALNFDGGGVKSYWFANFLTGDNGHDYCIVAVNARFPTSPTTTTMLTSVSLMDITANTYYGESFYGPGEFSDTTVDAKTSHLHTYATSPDQFSTLVATSFIPGAEFNLSYQAQGPNLYQAGGGIFTWGDNTAYAFDNPEALPSGTITAGGKVVNIVPHKSICWFDVQYGPGYAPEGWHAFVIILNNGVKIAIMNTVPLLDAGFRDSISTIVYLDGHHEVWPMDTNIHPSNPFVSPNTSITYYQDYFLNIPGKAAFHVHLPVQGGEVTLRSDPIPANTNADSYATFEGFFDGKPVRGVGIAERHVPKVNSP